MAYAKNKSWNSWKRNVFPSGAGLRGLSSREIELMEDVDRTYSAGIQDQGLELLEDSFDLSDSEEDTRRQSPPKATTVSSKGPGARQEICEPCFETFQGERIDLLGDSFELSDSDIDGTPPPRRQLSPRREPQLQSSARRHLSPSRGAPRFGSPPQSISAGRHLPTFEGFGEPRLEILHERRFDPFDLSGIQEEEDEGIGDVSQPRMKPQKSSDLRTGFEESFLETLDDMQLEPLAAVEAMDNDTPEILGKTNLEKAKRLVEQEKSNEEVIDALGLNEPYLKRVYKPYIKSIEAYLNFLRDTPALQESEDDNEETIHVAVDKLYTDEDVESFDYSTLSPEQQENYNVLKEYVDLGYTDEEIIEQLELEDDMWYVEKVQVIRFYLAVIRDRLQMTEEPEYYGPAITMFAKFRPTDLKGSSLQLYNMAKEHVDDGFTDRQTINKLIREGHVLDDDETLDALKFFVHYARHQQKKEKESGEIDEENERHELKRCLEEDWPNKRAINWIINRQGYTSEQVNNILKLYRQMKLENKHSHRAAVLRSREKPWHKKWKEYTRNWPSAISEAEVVDKRAEKRRPERFVSVGTRHVQNTQEEIGYLRKHPKKSGFHETLLDDLIELDIDALPQNDQYLYYTLEHFVERDYTNSVIKYVLIREGIVASREERDKMHFFLLSIRVKRDEIPASVLAEIGAIPPATALEPRTVAALSDAAVPQPRAELKPKDEAFLHLLEDYVKGGISENIIIENLIDERYIYGDKKEVDNLKFIIDQLRASAAPTAALAAAATSAAAAATAPTSATVAASGQSSAEAKPKNKAILQALERYVKQGFSDNQVIMNLVTDGLATGDEEEVEKLTFIINQTRDSTSSAATTGTSAKRPAKLKLHDQAFHDLLEKYIDERLSNDAIIAKVKAEGHISGKEDEIKNVTYIIDKLRGPKINAPLIRAKLEHQKNNGKSREYIENLVRSWSKRYNPRQIQDILDLVKEMFEGPSPEQLRKMTEIAAAQEAQEKAREKPKAKKTKKLPTGSRQPSQSRTQRQSRGERELAREPTSAELKRGRGATERRREEGPSRETSQVELKVPSRGQRGETSQSELRTPSRDPSGSELRKGKTPVRREQAGPSRESSQAKLEMQARRREPKETPRRQATEPRLETQSRRQQPMARPGRQSTEPQLDERTTRQRGLREPADRGSRERLGQGATQERGGGLRRTESSTRSVQQRKGSSRR